MLVRGAPEQSTYQCRGRDLLGGGLTPQPSIEIFGDAQVERHVERRTSLGDLSFRRLGFLLRVLLPDGSDLGVDAGVAISLGHCELCLSYSRRSGPVVFHGSSLDRVGHEG